MTAAEADRLRELARGKLVLEIGAQFGFSTILLAQAGTHVHSVDWHLGDPNAGYRDTAAEFFRNILPWRNSITAHVGRTADVLPVLGSALFDLVFIDGDHRYEVVRYDLTQVLRLVKPDGVIACHDYGRFGVQAAVDELLGPPDKLVGTLAVCATRARRTGRGA